jgi:ubiquinone/menaquinone biosynthesis C-methylase UbiE
MNNMNKANIRYFYKTYAKAYDEKIASLEIYQESYDFLLNKIQDGASILDLACGPGNVSHYFAQHRSGLKITGVDIAEEMIEIARRRIQQGVFVVKDICEVHFETTFDCVVCAFGIPYLDLSETAHVAQCISTCLKPNGYFYLSFMEGQKSGFEKTSLANQDELFIYYHTEKDILNTLRRQSLSVIKKFDVDYHEQDGTITNEIIFIGAKSR